MNRFRRPERYRKAVLRNPCKSPPGDTSPQRIVEISLSAVSKDPLSEIPIVQLDQRCVNQFTEVAIATLLSIDIAPKQAVSRYDVMMLPKLSTEKGARQ